MKSIQETCQRLAVLLILSITTNALWAQSPTPGTNVGSESERNENRQKKSSVAPQAAATASSANGLYEQARKHAARGNLEMAIAMYETFLQQADIHKDAQERLQTLRQQLEQKQLTEKLERKYSNGMAALKARDWARAVLEFETILEHNTPFRDSGKRLIEAQNKLANENSETAAVRFYALGIAAMNWNELDEARMAFQALLQLKPNYRDAPARLQTIEKMRKQALVDNGEALLADSLYRAAELAASKSDWVQAVIALEALRIIQPDYREAANRLAEARSALTIMQASHRTGEAAPAAYDFSSVQMGGAMAVLVLPVVGWLLLSPAARVRRSMLRHDYRSAAQVYEALLTRHPSRVKYFPKLANIYLLEGRKDEEAMKVYRNVLQLNLAVRNREEINAVVAQQYLQEGRTDADAIEVLEKQLEAELYKQSRALVKR